MTPFQMSIAIQSHQVPAEVLSGVCLFPLSALYIFHEEYAHS